MGVDTEGRPLKSLVDLAAAKGKSTGLSVLGCNTWLIPLFLWLNCSQISNIMGLASWI